MTGSLNLMTELLSPAARLLRQRRLGRGWRGEDQVRLESFQSCGADAFDLKQLLGKQKCHVAGMGREILFTECDDLFGPFFAKLRQNRQRLPIGGVGIDVVGKLAESGRLRVGRVGHVLRVGPKAQEQNGPEDQDKRDQHAALRRRPWLRKTSMTKGDWMV